MAEQKKGIVMPTDEESIVKSIYKSNSADYKKFGMFHTFKARKRHIITVTSVFGGFAVVFGVLSFFLKGFLFGAIVCVMFAALFPLASYIYQNIKINSYIRKNSNFGKLVNEYLFTEKSLFLRLSNGTREEKYEFPYQKSFFRVYETEDAFYMYLNARQAFIIIKQGIEKGESADISRILDKELGKAFFPLKKSR